MEQPKRLALIGGGPIGVEFAQMFSRFGVEVTILEQSDELLFFADKAVDFGEFVVEETGNGGLFF